VFNNITLTYLVTSGETRNGRFSRKCPTSLSPLNYYHLFPENEDIRQMLVETGFEDIKIYDGKDDYLVSAQKSC